VDAVVLSKAQGRPFKVAEIVSGARKILEESR